MLQVANAGLADIVEQRHPSLYLADGDLVVSAALNAPEDGIVQFFRIHRDTLVRHSPIFADMFAIGAASECTNDMYDGVPRVHLPDDGKDVEVLLRALHNPATMPLERLHPDTALKFDGVMNLAVKYEVTLVRTIIIRQLEADWPNELDDWERLQRRMQTRLDETRSPGTEQANVDFKYVPEPVSVIRFAMKYNCPSVLPAAFFELARMPNIVEWDDSENRHFEDMRPARWNLLDAPDLLRIVQGKKLLHSRWLSALSRIRGEVIAFCAQNEFIQERYTGCEWFIKNLLADLACCFHTMDVLKGLRHLEGIVPTYSRALSGELDHWCCAMGYDTFREMISEELTRIWDDLPSVFDLESVMEAMEKEE